MDANQKVRFPCSACGHALGAPAAYVGKRARCTKCSQVVTIPAPPTSTGAGVEKPGAGAGAPPFAQRLRALLASRLPDAHLSVYPDVEPEHEALARARAGVPATEQVLGLLDYSSSASAVRCLLFGALGLYYMDWSETRRGYLPYLGFATATDADWKRFGPVALGAGDGDGGERSLRTEKGVVRLLRDVRQLCLAHPGDVPDEKALAAAARAREEEEEARAEDAAERQKVERLCEFVRRHIPTIKGIQHVGVACETVEHQSAGAMLAGGMAGIVLGEVLDAGLDGAFGSGGFDAVTGLVVGGSFHHVTELVILTGKNLYMLALGAVPSVSFSLETLVSLVPIEEPEVVGLSHLAVSECSVAANRGTLGFWAGADEYELSFPNALLRDNVSMPRRIASAAEARRG